MAQVKAIATLPPYAPYIDEVIGHPLVEGIRLNTVHPVVEPLEDLLRRLDEKTRAAGKILWVDLKCRQLRVKTYGTPPFTAIELSHNITVNVPVKAYFSHGTETATVLRVDGNRLIMQEGPRKVVGPGEGINIPDPSLQVQGYLTELDKQYIEAGLKAGVKKFMLSYVEGAADLDTVKQLYPEAEMVGKIESRKGLDYVSGDWKGECRLMVARGDLFTEVAMPHHIVEATQMILEKDPNAIVASRIFDSLFFNNLQPTCEDIGDVDNLLRMGYRHFMLGDEVCMQRDTLISGLNLLTAMARRYR